MGSGMTLLAALLLLPVAAGCRTAESPGEAGPAPELPAARSAAGCPDPVCAAAAASVADRSRAAAEAKRAAEGEERAAMALVRESPSLALETEGDRPFRGRMVSGENSTFVEVRVVEVSPPSVDHPGLVRYAMRLCAEDGTTSATDLRPSRLPGRSYNALPAGWTSEAEGGVRFHRYYACAGGTAWEFDGIADVLDGGRVRFSLRGVFIGCTK